MYRGSGFHECICELHCMFKSNWDGVFGGIANNWGLPPSCIWDVISGHANITSAGSHVAGREVINTRWSQSLTVTLQPKLTFWSWQEKNSHSQKRLSEWSYPILNIFDANYENALLWLHTAHAKKLSKLEKLVIPLSWSFPVQCVQMPNQCLRKWADKEIWMIMPISFNGIQLNFAKTVSIRCAMTCLKRYVTRIYIKKPIETSSYL